MKTTSGLLFIALLAAGAAHAQTQVAEPWVRGTVSGQRASGACRHRCNECLAALVIRAHANRLSVSACGGRAIGEAELALAVMLRNVVTSPEIHAGSPLFHLPCPPGKPDSGHEIHHTPGGTKGEYKSPALPAPAPGPRVKGSRGGKTATVVADETPAATSQLGLEVPPGPDHYP